MDGMGRRAGLRGGGKAGSMLEERRSVTMGRTHGRGETRHEERKRTRRWMDKSTRARLCKLALLVLLMILYKVLVYAFSNVAWLLCARIVLLGTILALLLNLLFPSK